MVNRRQILKKAVANSAAGQTSKPSGMVSKDLKDFSIRLSQGDNTLPKKTNPDLQVMPNNTVFDTKKMQGVFNEKGNTDYIPPKTKKKESTLRKIFRKVTGK